MPDDEPREPRESRGQPLRIDVRLVHADLPPPISTEPSKPGGENIRNSVELARNGYTLGLLVKQCRARIVKAMSLDVALSVRLRDAHERMSRQAYDAEPDMKKGQIR